MDIMEIAYETVSVVLVRSNYCLEVKQKLLGLFGPLFSLRPLLPGRLNRKEQL